MNELRRRLLQSMLLGGAAALSGCERQIAGQPGELSSARAPSLLVLGGTGFVGPHVVRTALARGFEVTLFNRGRTAPELFGDLELLIGDRGGNLNAIQDQILQNRRWDAVIDLSGFRASDVAATARLLSVASSHYVFFSTAIVYESYLDPNDETSPLYTSSSSDYGPQKAEAERRAESEMPGRVAILRPTFIGGPGDTTDRLTYWPVRVSRGGEILVPGPQDHPTKFIDVRDVADFAIHCVEEGLVGAYNTLPENPYPMSQIIADCQTVTGQSVTATWVSPEFVRDNRIDADDGLPIWESPLGEYGAAPLTSGRKAAENGLVTRPPIETIRDTFEWWESLSEGRRNRLRAGLSANREAELLALWHQQSA